MGAGPQHTRIRGKASAGRSGAGKTVGRAPRRAKAEATPAIPYQAGSTSGVRSMRWTPNSGGPNAVMGSLPTLRSRSRDKRRNDGLADTIIEVLVANAIGTGIKPQFQTKDAALNRQLAELWVDTTQETDADGRCDFYGQQALAFAAMLEGGDSFTRMRTRLPSDGLTVPLQLQILESEFCPYELNRQLQGGGWIQQGVEFGPIGNRVAYHLWRQHPNDTVQRQMRNNADMTPARVGAGDVMHLSKVRRPGQIRGEPWLTRALITLHDFDKYIDAQILRQQIAAMFAGFIKRNPGSEPFGDDLETDEENPNVAMPSLEPATMQALEEGEELEFSTPPGPGDSFEVFVRYAARRIATSGGIMYEQLTGDHTQITDRTYRAASNDFKRRIQPMQWEFIFQWCRPWLVRWSEVALLAGAFTLPAGVTLKDVQRVRWMPQAWPYINPEQDVSAKKAEVRAGFRSRADVVSEQGEDVEVVDAEIDRDNKRADRLELVFDTDPRKTDGSGKPAKAGAGEGGGEDPPEDGGQDAGAG